ncbi:helix-turn-helix domain-containing protein [Evansella halocellulosilytica]|uniref:helix-turn-helix domain-containing protein n=1 Tax=Evansella halocellulosilytica TaxID=2011013 RepID=UPI000BB8F84D|nr:helix-turn-helix transcriptional regulator [Evansella halocellulosilytica]
MRENKGIEKTKQIRIKLDELLKKHGKTQKDLHQLTGGREEGGIRTAAISELCNNQRTSINKDHLEKIATVLNITDISELIEIIDLKKDDGSNN